METQNLTSRLAKLVKTMKAEKLHRRESFTLAFDLLMDVTTGETPDND